MNWFLLVRGNIVWGSKRACGGEEEASSLDSDKSVGEFLLAVEVSLATEVSLHACFRRTVTGLPTVVPRVTGLWVSSDENDADCKGGFFIEQLLGIGDEVREDTPEKIVPSNDGGK